MAGEGRPRMNTALVLRILALAPETNGRVAV